MTEKERSSLAQDDFDEFEVDLTDVRGFTPDLPSNSTAANQAMESVWVSGFLRIAQAEIDSERDGLRRLKDLKH